MSDFLDHLVARSQPHPAGVVPRPLSLYEPLAPEADPLPGSEVPELVTPSAPETPAPTRRASLESPLPQRRRPVPEPPAALPSPPTTEPDLQERLRRLEDWLRRLSSPEEARRHPSPVLSADFPIWSAPAPALQVGEGQSPQTVASKQFMPRPDADQSLPARQDPQPKRALLAPAPPPIVRTGQEETGVQAPMVRPLLPELSRVEPAPLPPRPRQASASEKQPDAPAPHPSNQRPEVPATAYLTPRLAGPPPSARPPRSHRSDQTAPESQSVVKVSIGRIEIRATRPVVTAGPTPRPSREPLVMSLDEYLKRRSGGSG